ncbi:MAG: Hsp20/alpha crystallin family protein [Candidatus Saccharibacteria bacterium]
MHERLSPYNGFVPYGMLDFPHITQAPRVEMFETDNEILINAEIPGMDSKSDISIDVGDTSITLSGELKKEYEANRGGVYHSERYYGHFNRTIPVPRYGDLEKASATYKNGILQVKVPKNEKRSKRLEIQ